MNRRLFISIVLLITLFSCNNDKVKTTQQKTKTTSKPKVGYDINLKLQSSDYTVGDTIKVSYTTNAKTQPDSVSLIIDNKPVQIFYANPFVWNTSKWRVGSVKMNFKFCWGDSIQQIKSANVVLKSDIVPEQYTYKINKKWKHNSKAYTQGLEFNEGILYEGTGQYGESMLTKIDLDKENLLESINLSADVFGEGITVMGDKVYQITWKSSIGYVYDKATLEKLYEFNYPTDGWGLTNNGKELIMSDGTENIYFLDNEYFAEQRRVQVYDNKCKVQSLNELELINGLVYANIYGTFKVVAFSPQTGKVLKVIDFSGIEKNEPNRNSIDVFNGIAFDKNKKRLVVTGKWWANFYSVELVKK